MSEGIIESGFPKEGILLVDKPAGITSFGVVARIRRRFQVQKVGHGGTLDPFATGLLVILIGRKFTRIAGEFLHDDKEYQATLLLGSSTDTHDLEGEVQERSDYVPTLEEIEQVIGEFQGELLQTPPMFSAKRIGGKRLYDLARQGREVHREATPIRVKVTLVRYTYPELEIHVTCSKGTYIRVLAHDMGVRLKSLAHLTALRRLRSGKFKIEQCRTLDAIMDQENGRDR